eukprot:6656281-Prymnesium_polylepis.2
MFVVALRRCSYVLASFSVRSLKACSTPTATPRRSPLERRESRASRASTTTCDSFGCISDSRTLGRRGANLTWGPL